MVRQAGHPFDPVRGPFRRDERPHPNTEAPRRHPFDPVRGPFRRDEDTRAAGPFYTSPLWDK